MVRVTIDSYGHGGLGVGRVDGKVHFVEGAIPGDVVEAEVIRSKKTWARARATRVVEPGPARRTPPCPHAGACGGCDLQHAEEAAQRRWKREVVADQLARLAGIDAPPVGAVVVPDGDLGYRNRMDFSVLDGRPALHRRSSRDLVALDLCLLLVPPLADLFQRLGNLSGANGLTLRAGVNTGELLAAVAGRVPEAAADWGVPVCRVVKGGTEVVVGRDHLHEEVAGVRLRITGTAFFQNSTVGAETLVGLVDGAVDAGGTLVDLYAGGGLFALTIGHRFDRVVAVEAAGPAVGDLRANTAGTDVEVRAGRVEEVVPATTGDVTVVVDPPRSGLGPAGVAAVAAVDPRRLVYVSCEPSSFARDVALLADLGFGLESATPVDMFPQTHHVEVVAVLER